MKNIWTIASKKNINKTISKPMSNTMDNTMNMPVYKSTRSRKSTFAALALGATLAVQMISAIPASALYDPENPNPVYEDGMMYIMAVPISAELPVAPATVTWEGKALDMQGHQAYVSEAGQVMVPLRPIMEGMGYKVNWLAQSNTAEMIRGAHWVTLTPGKDVYTFGKMAPGSLGIASEVKANRTYVPISFFSGILPFSTEMTPDGTLAITEQKAAASTDASNITVQLPVETSSP